MGPAGKPGQQRPGPPPNLVPNLAPLMLVQPLQPGSAPRRARHRGAWAGFVLAVLLPFAALCWYLWAVAPDRYGSTTAFSVRREDPSAGLEAMGGILGLSAASSADTDVLYDFLLSQDMVARLAGQMDLAAMMRAGGADPVLGLPDDPTIEDLTWQWQRMLRIDYDQAERIMSLTVLAATPHEAQGLAEAVLAEGSKMVNALSDQARADATRQAEAELDRARDLLRQAEADLTAYRNRHQIVDPAADLASQMGVIDRLNSQLADALVEIDLLRDATAPTDPRIAIREDKIAIIRKRIAAERTSLGSAGSGGAPAWADRMGEFERLELERRFAEERYGTALSAYELAQAAAGRQARYLATHIRPTLAERADYPRRVEIAALAALFLVLGWSVILLILWSLRDRH